ncbi:hypothetical protein FPZ42_18795 [Mucilaginibacter achroorhodeus]|uniref:Uncharacterized protein n=1 Tax=Mucilaginibacter achroorhodeus TaxID=2599294 RepID=A0A563U047_9SPHI|nr:hypothetical protein [Mucilaginibacter achroorhodeus]TWR23829.1 hypothetical protein FPZ42_18795 [Mucilaginibacter achroorhodeus]
MRYLFTLLSLILLLNCKITIGQHVDCDKTKISNSDKFLLNEFWKKFTLAINAKNKAELSTLIKFPFTCDYCEIKTVNKTNGLYLKVTKKLFYQSQYKIFLDPKLQKIVNKENILDILSVTSENNHCHYDFSYVSIKQSKDWEGQQHFFSLKKVNGKFVITSAWTIP